VKGADGQHNWAGGDGSLRSRCFGTAADSARHDCLRADRRSDRLPDQASSGGTPSVDQVRRERGTRNSRRSEQLRTGEREVPPELSALKDRIAAMVGGLTGAAADLQETSRGIHPAILSRGGLGPALKTLRRSRDFARQRWPFGQLRLSSGLGP
jgi:hypothetical protein